MIVNCSFDAFVSDSTLYKWYGFLKGDYRCFIKKTNGSIVEI